jgi:hypothetical protein
MIPNWKTPLLYALAALLAAVSLLAVYQYTNVLEAKADLASEREGRAEDRRLAERAARIASETYRTEEQRRTTAAAKVIKEAQDEAQLAKSAAAGARSERDGLRADLAAATARARAAARDSSTGPGSTPAPDFIGLLGRLFSESDDLAGQMAEAADGSRVAGLACERQYDSLTHK